MSSATWSEPAALPVSLPQRPRSRTCEYTKLCSLSLSYVFSRGPHLTDRHIKEHRTPGQLLRQIHAAVISLVSLWYQGYLWMAICEFKFHHRTGHKLGLHGHTWLWNVSRWRTEHWDHVGRQMSPLEQATNNCWDKWAKCSDLIHPSQVPGESQNINHLQTPNLSSLPPLWQTTYNLLYQKDGSYRYTASALTASISLIK